MTHGTVIGEIPGRFVVDWCAGANEPLGDATLTIGDYNGANFAFGRAGDDDGIEPDDPLYGQTFDGVTPSPQPADESPIE